MLTCIVDFENSDFGSVLATIRNRRLRHAVISCVAANGGPDEQSAFFQSVEELRETLSLVHLREFEASGEVSVKMDRFEAANLYGYNAHTDLGERLYQL